MDEEKSLIDYLKKVSPGTALRTVIDDITRSELGGLIVFDSPELVGVIEGGFRVNCRFTSQRLFELCKMDGAVIISQDLKRILYANVLLAPDHTINSKETGTRHKAAERTAKQAKTFVIAISERKKKTTLYFINTKYILKKSEELIRDISSDLQVLENQREILNELISKLNILEISGLASASDICKVLQRAEIVLKISESIKRNFTELGREGSIMQIRFRELLKDVEKVEDKVMRDYSVLSLKKAKTLLSNMTFDGLLELESISRLILEKKLEESVSARGYRFMSNLNLSEKEISEIVNKFKNLTNMFEAKPEELETILKNRASKVTEDLNSLREQVLAGKTIF